MLENKLFGIFALLDEECRMPNPKTESFMQKITYRHRNCIAFSSLCRTKSDFVIRHFGQDVTYNSVSISEHFTYSILE